MNIILDSHNKLLHRRDVIVSKQFASNPGFAVAKESVVTHFKAPSDCVVILAIRGGFGSSLFTIEARIYDSTEQLHAVEPRPKVKKLEAGK